MVVRGRQARGKSGAGRRPGVSPRRRAARVLTVVLSLFLFLALLSFSPGDGGRGNLFGAPGRAVAGLLIQGLGFAAFLFVAMVMLWAGTAAFSDSRIRPTLRLPGIVIVTFCATPWPCAPWPPGPGPC